MLRFNALIAWLWLPALVSIGWVLSQLPFSAVAQTIRNLSPGQWLVWLAVNSAIVAVAVRRWQVFTELLALPVSFVELLKIRQAGQAVSFITPGPQFGGEPLQIYWLHSRSRSPLSGALWSLGLDRFYELWINFMMLSSGVSLLAFSRASTATDWPKLLSVLVGLALAISVFGGLLLRRPERLSVWLERLAGQWRQNRYLQAFDTLSHTAPINSRRMLAESKPALLKALMLSLLGWGGLSAELWLLLGFVGGPLDLSSFLLMMVAMRLAFLLPLPGGVGSLEAALFWAFQHLGQPAEAAMGLIALMRLRDTALLLAGFCCLSRLGRR